MTKSASQRKAAPRKTVPQQPETQSSRKNGSGQSQSSKSKQGKPQQGKGQPAVKQRSTLLTIVLVLVSLGAVIDAIIPLLYRRETYQIDHPVGSIAVGLVVYPSMVAAFHALIPMLILGYGLARDNAMAKLE